MIIYFFFITPFFSPFPSLSLCFPPKKKHTHTDKLSEKRLTEFFSTTYRVTKKIKIKKRVLRGACMYVCIVHTTKNTNQLSLSLNPFFFLSFFPSFFLSFFTASSPPDPQALPFPSSHPPQPPPSASQAASSPP